MPIGAARAGLFGTRSVQTLLEIAIHRWAFSEGSGTTAADSVGTADMLLTGVTWDSTEQWVDGFAGSGDGSNDYGDVGPTTLGDIRDTGFAIAFSMKMDSPQVTGRWCGLRNGGGGEELEVSHNAADSNGVTFAFDDDNGNRNQVFVDNAGIFDGQPHRVVCTSADTNANNMEIWIDGSAANAQVAENAASSNSSDYTAFSVPMYWFAWNQDGSVQNYLQTEIDNAIITDEEPGSERITADYDAQPWV